MDPILIAQLIETLTSVARLAGTIDPALIDNDALASIVSSGSAIPSIVQAGETTIALLRGGQTEPTAEEEAQIRAALESANNALQAS